MNTKYYIYMNEEKTNDHCHIYVTGYIIIIKASPRRTQKK